MLSISVWWISSFNSGLRNRSGSVPIHFPYNKNHKNKSHKVSSHDLASHSQSPCLEMTRSGNCSGSTATASRKLWEVALFCYKILAILSKICHSYLKIIYSCYLIIRFVQDRGPVGLPKTSDYILFFIYYIIWIYFSFINWRCCWKQIQ